MTAFLAQLGSRLADRWATLVLGPGLLLVAAGAVAARAGQRHAVDIGWVSRSITEVASSPASRSPGVLVLAMAGVLAVGMAAGLTAAAVGWVMERAWMAPGSSRPGQVAARWRQRQWDAADSRLTDAKKRALQATASIRLDPASAAAPAAANRRATALRVASASRRRDSIALTRPERPTWIADRIRTVELRVRSTYALELAAAWPRLWPVLNDTLRADLAAAQNGYGAAARLTGWGLLYAVVAVWWWPAGVISVAVILTAWARARAAVSVLAELLEAAVDLHIRDLAAQLGIACDGPLTRTAGRGITELINKNLATTSADRDSDDGVNDQT